MMGVNIYWLLLLLDLLIVVFLIPTIILQRRESGATLAWILTIVLIPFLGLLAFWVFGTTRLHIRRSKRLKAEAQLTTVLHKSHRQPIIQPAEGDFPPTLLQLAKKLDGVGPLAGNDVTLFRQGFEERDQQNSETFDAIETTIDSAQDHIHLIYYIWEPDRTGARFRDALMRACQRGVKVRLLLDDVGSRKAKPIFFQNLLEAGGRVERFLPVNPLSRQLSLNNRNHRKIIVVDGNIGFTGSMNVGDVYAGLEEPWYDLHARIQGLVVHSLQEVFCQDWYHATAEDLICDAYFPPITSIASTPLIQGNPQIWAQLLASGPADERWRSIHTLLFGAINLAQQRVWIETPYFVPDPSILMALETAALRGVDVRLLLPEKSDHPLVLYAGRSFLDELLAAGVRVFELQGAMPHAKTATIDSIFSTLGSANMDQRSFRLNFEANLFFYGAEVATQLEQDFLLLCSQSIEVTQENRRDISKYQRFAEGVGRVFAPLL